MIWFPEGKYQRVCLTQRLTQRMRRGVSAGGKLFSCFKRGWVTKQVVRVFGVKKNPKFLRTVHAALLDKQNTTSRQVSAICLLFDISLFYFTVLLTYFPSSRMHLMVCRYRSPSISVSESTIIITRHSEHLTNYVSSTPSVLMASASTP
jgi:hypothetical protein